MKQVYSVQAVVNFWIDGNEDVYYRIELPDGKILANGIILKTVDPLLVEYFKNLTENPITKIRTIRPVTDMEVKAYNMQCPRCGYKWLCTTDKRYVQCPDCMYKFRREKGEIR